MTKSFSGYQSESGKIHQSEHDAWLDDLATMLVGSGSINESSASGFVKHLTTTPNAISIFAEIVGKVKDTTPAPIVKPPEAQPLAAPMIEAPGGSNSVIRDV